jgi:hypothetical protein
VRSEIPYFRRRFATQRRDQRRAFRRAAIVTTESRDLPPFDSSSLCVQEPAAQVLSLRLNIAKIISLPFRLAEAGVSDSHFSVATNVASQRGR